MLKEERAGEPARPFPENLEDRSPDDENEDRQEQPNPASNDESGIRQRRTAGSLPLSS